MLQSWPTRTQGQVHHQKSVRLLPSDMYIIPPKERNYQHQPSGVYPCILKGEPNQQKTTTKTTSIEPWKLRSTPEPGTLAVGLFALCIYIHQTNRPTSISLLFFLSLVPATETCRHAANSIPPNKKKRTMWSQLLVSALVGALMSK